MYYINVKIMKQIKKIPIKTAVLLTALVFVTSGCGISREGSSRTRVLINNNITEESLEPDTHFAAALKDFVDQHYNKSYNDIQKGINYMEGVAAMSKGPFRKGVEESIDELMELADNVRFDKVDGVNELNYFFSRAGRALGNDHVMIVEKVLKNKNPGNRDYTLVIDIKNLDKPDGKVNTDDYLSEENQILSDAGKIAGRIQTKYDISRTETDRAISELKTGLTSLG